MSIIRVTGKRLKRHRLGAQYLKNMNNSGKSVRKKIGNLIGKKWIKDMNKILPSSRYSSVCFTLAVLREGHLRTVIGASPPEELTLKGLVMPSAGERISLYPHFGNLFCSIYYS